MSCWFLVFTLFYPFFVLWRNKPILSLGLRSNAISMPPHHWCGYWLLETQLVKPLCVVNFVSAGVHWVAFSKYKKCGWGHSNQPWFALSLSSAETMVVTAEPVSSAARKYTRLQALHLLCCCKQGWTGAPWKKKWKLLGLIEKGCEPWADPFSVGDGESKPPQLLAGQGDAQLWSWPFYLCKEDIDLLSSGVSSRPFSVGGCGPW